MEQEPADNSEAAGEPTRRSRREARHSGTGTPKSPLLSWLREIGLIVGVALVLSFLIKTFLFRAFFIPSTSMEDTLEVDDRIFVNLLVPQPFALSRGDWSPVGERGIPGVAVKCADIRRNTSGEGGALGRY